MDDSAQTNQQSATKQTTQQIPPAQQDSSKQAVPPVVSSGSVSKEYAPVVPVTTEYVQPAPHEADPSIPKEAARLMEVAKNVEQPQLSDEHRKLGLQEAKESLPAPATLSDGSAFPLTSAQVTQSQMKRYSIWDSFKWFGAKVGRQMLRVHKRLFQ